MKRLNLLLISICAVLATAWAQEVQTVVVQPFNAVGEAEPYGLGLATTLQRSLNVINGVYAPPVGDVLLVNGRLQAQARLSVDTLTEAFGASAIVSAQVSAEGNNAAVLLGLAGPAFPEIRDVTVTGPLDDPQRLAASVVDTVVRELGLGVSVAERQQLDSVVAQTPSLPSLSAVAQASLRLPSLNLTELNAAANLDSGSSWVLAERARGLLLAGDERGALLGSLSAIQAEPADIEALVSRGLILLTTGDTETARQAFEAALVLNPAHALALQGRGRTATDSAEARASFEAALQAYPRLSEAYLDLARLEARESTARALQTLRQGAERIPDSIALRRAVVQQAVALGDPSGALQYLQGELADPAANAPALYALATELPASLSDDALAILREGRERYADSMTLALAEAEVLQRSGDDAAAETVLQAALAGAPDNLEIINQLAISQARQGKLEEAKATLSSVATQNDALGVNLAKLYLQAGQSDAAITTLEPLLTRAPEDAELYTLYGVALGRSGRFDQALNALDQAIALDPNDEAARAAKASIKQNRSLTGGTEVALQPEAGASFQRGITTLQAGDFEAAASEFARARELQDSGLIAFYQGYALQRSGLTREALPNYERALQEFPESDIVLNNLGYAYLQLGRYDRALEFLNRAVTANPDNSEAQLNLGITLYSLDRYAPAVEAWERAVALEPGLEASISEQLEAARTRAGQ